ncbi:hypothetical protein BJF90_09225 [Pseudonocardia sp. CNS-004]|nr:hypothetical protein BJF90_09225 [Pseudonocardia sp. CNS-004]
MSLHARPVGVVCLRYSRTTIMFAAIATAPSTIMVRGNARKAWPKTSTSPPNSPPTAAVASPMPVLHRASSRGVATRSAASTARIGQIDPKTVRR